MKKTTAIIWKTPIVSNLVFDGENSKIKSRKTVIQTKVKYKYWKQSRKPVRLCTISKEVT